MELDFPARVKRVTIAAAVAGSAALTAPSAAAFAADRLPDLGMAHPSDLKVDTNTVPGRRLLRYTAVIVNVGSGPFEVHGRRPDTSTPMSVTQRIYDDSATGFHEVGTSAEMFHAGDGHDHWHVRDLETGELLRLDNGSKVGALAKHGFCFYDNAVYRLTLPGAPQSPVYTSCGSLTSLHVTPGLSVGWGDRYPWNIAYQYIDITDVTNGHYRLEIGASTAPLGFQESSYSNNTSWVNVRLLRHSAKILSYGPAA
jgi:hypothetical protein